MTRLLLAAACACCGLYAQVATQSNAGYQTPAQRKSMADGLASPSRDARQKPRELVAAMGLRPGMTVADVGTGPGYMLPFLSEAVGPSGRVLAEDVFPDFLDRARENAKRRGLANVSFIEGSATDPRLPERGVDCVLVLDAYHHFDYPEKMLAGIARALRPGGKLVVVEYYKRPGAMPNGRAMSHIRLDEPDVVREIEANGFRLVSSRVHVKDSQYMLILESNSSK